MADYNYMAIQGRLTRDPDAKITKGGTECTTFTVAVNRVPNKDTGENIADFFECVAYGNTARFINSYFKKGNQILCAGSMQTRDYVDKEGKKRKFYELWVKDTHFVGKKEQSGQFDELSVSVGTILQNDDKKAENGKFEALTNEEDLPF